MEENIDLRKIPNIQWIHWSSQKRVCGIKNHNCRIVKLLRIARDPGISICLSFFIQFRTSLTTFWISIKIGYPSGCILSNVDIVQGMIISMLLIKNLKIRFRNPRYNSRKIFISIGWKLDLNCCFLQSETESNSILRLPSCSTPLSPCKVLIQFLHFFWVSSL